MKIMTVDAPASSKTTGWNFVECSNKAKRMQTSGMVSYAPPEKTFMRAR